jgi:nitrite reductase (NO-forming)
MKKLVVSLVFVLAMSLIIGQTWIAPFARSRSADAEHLALAAYRVDGSNGTIVNITLRAHEAVQEIAPGINYHVWTFNGTTPGPVIRVHLGDSIHFTLYNDSTIGMQHSIDFHAAMTPWADLPKAGATSLQGNYQPVDPGHSKTFDWVAMFPGVFMYHCGVPPVLEHIANGMYGAIIVEPPNLPKEREYVLVSSEFYPGPKPVNGLYEGDLGRMLAVDPQYVVFNGKADQYKAAPLQVRPNEPFRLWVLNAGPTLTNAFHVIGTMFDQTHPTGNPANTMYGLQTWGIPPGDAAMFELNIPDPGLYPFVTHAFAYTGLGAVGLIKVDPNAPAAPDSYPLLADPFSAGVTVIVQPGQGGSGSPAPSVTPSPSGSGGTTTCVPAGTQVHLTAHNAMFDTDCLAAPAGAAFTVVLNNLDPGVPHNLSIYTDATASQTLFTGALVSGPNKTTYRVRALKPGTYYFRCDVHPATMHGTFIVK